MNYNDLLKNNVDKIHSTSMGIDRIKRNLNLDIDVVEYIKKTVLDSKTIINKKGKNYYCENNNIIVTINSNSYTIITAHIK